MAAIGTLFIPAKGALVPNLVPSEQLLSANSLSQTSQMLAILIGPALAGLTLKIAGARVTSGWRLSSTRRAS